MPAGNLRYRIGFYKRGAPSPDVPDYGSDAGYPGVATFVTYGGMAAKLGGENILAARLTGRNFVNVTVRQDSNTRAVTTDWICKNEDTGEVFNIRSIIDPHSDDGGHHLWLEMLCEKGVAT